MAVSFARVQEIIKLRARLYGHTYNPECIRTGNKVLRQRLKGPVVADYYPPRSATLKDLQRYFTPELETFDEDESDRLDTLALAKARGKGPPKKKRTKEESRKFGKHKGKGSPGAAAPAKPPPAN